MTATLKDKVLFVSGASRGIGLAIALRAGKDGGRVAVAAKTATPHPKLPGTIFTAAEEIERAGGKALPLVCDIRDEESVKSAIQKTVEKFGGIDIVVNNASAISLTDTQNTTLKKYNLMHEINARGTWLVTKYALPYLIESGRQNRNPHILNISPPLTITEQWFSGHVAYSIAKYNMSLCILGWAGEFREHGIAANVTAIDTAALKIVDKFVASKSRTPQIVADAARLILTKDSTRFSGNFVLDEIILREHGQTEFDQYLVTPGNRDLALDYFIEDEVFNKLKLLWKEDAKKKNPKL
ncbi:4073_t:CDS:2 [Funneliformis geosporum]|uniref:Hydroxysteroid dehydrogenase-like protein 2 n=1 Tax=Funneliformis geosporum TaxID=1117311 RepID=A0A9W4WR60_9GLOM|nr:4073_t:CDS:2 [Funneliformis geosporum]CAI2180207.1 13992_t:CDS:2 [Funneliformis geosporum]